MTLVLISAINLSTAAPIFMSHYSSDETESHEDFFLTPDEEASVDDFQIEPSGLIKQDELMESANYKNIHSNYDQESVTRERTGKLHVEELIREVFETHATKTETVPIDKSLTKEGTFHHSDSGSNRGPRISASAEQPSKPEGNQRRIRSAINESISPSASEVRLNFMLNSSQDFLQIFYNLGRWLIDAIRPGPLPYGMQGNVHGIFLMLFIHVL